MDPREAGDLRSPHFWYFLWGDQMPNQPDPDPDTMPSERGATLVHAEREECAWPSLKDHSLVLVWDKREDRMAAKIVPTFKRLKGQ